MRAIVKAVPQVVAPSRLTQVITGQSAAIRAQSPAETRQEEVAFSRVTVGQVDNHL